MFTEEEPVSPVVLGNHSPAADLPSLRIKEGVTGAGSKSAKVLLPTGKGLSAPSATPPV